MDRIIESYITDFLKSQEIKGKDEKVQFELFATYCSVSQQYTELFDVTDLIVGDGLDCGIDGLAIIANGTMINSIEEIDDLIELNNGLNDVQFIFVQAKTSSKFSYGEIGTFGAGVKDFLSKEPQMPRNKFIENKSKLVEHIFNNATKLKNKPECILYYVTTGKWVDDQNCIARIKQVKNSLDDDNLFSSIEFIPVDSFLLQKYYRNTIDVIESNINFPDRVLLPEIPDANQAYLGYVDYKEYLKLITTDSGEIRKSVFYDNVRDYQGDNDVNHEIANTIHDEAGKFILFNNGVTIICKKLNNLRNVFTLSDYQIVNGCQTSHVLYHNKELIQNDLFVPVKIIETTDEDTVNSIIKATNRQTEVTNEQLIALNEFHRRLEAFYNTYAGNQRLYYERRSKQYNSVSGIERVRIVTIGIQIKAVASMFFDKPHMASRYYGRLLKSIDGIFSDEHKLLPYYTCAFLLYKLEYLFRNKLLPAQYRKFRYHILMMIKYEFAEDKIPQLNSKEMEDLCQKICDYAIDTNKFKGKCEEIIYVLEQNVPDVNNQEATKNAGIVTDLKNYYVK